MLEASSESCRAPHSSISAIQWNTTVVVKALTFKQIVGVNTRVKNLGLKNGTLDFTIVHRLYQRTQKAQKNTKERENREAKNFFAVRLEL